MLQNILCSLQDTGDCFAAARTLAALMGWAPLAMTETGTSETLGREIWASALANLLLMAAAKSEV